MNKKILFIDSGVGAISIVNAVRELEPRIDCLVFIDNKNAPFGNKSNKFLNKVCLKNIKTLLLRYDIGLIVLACNTLTVSSVHYLRDKLDIPIVGTEPNVKINDDALALCTEYTAKFCPLLKKHSNIQILPMPNLATLIDANLSDLNEVKPYLAKMLGPYKQYDNIILGCTHYNFIKKQLSAVFKKDLIWIENKYGVAKRVIQLIDDNFIGEPNVKLILSKPDSDFEKNLIKFIQ